MCPFYFVHRKMPLSNAHCSKWHPFQEYTCVLSGKELDPHYVLGNNTPQGISWVFPSLLGKNIPLDKTLGMPFWNHARKHNLRHRHHHIQDLCSCLNYRSDHPYTGTFSQDLLQDTNFLSHTVIQILQSVFSRIQLHIKVMQIQTKGV